MKKEDHDKPTMAVEDDGEIILEVEMDRENADWIRAARKKKMRRFDWKVLNKQQVGSYAEYFVKMEFTMYGFQVYTTEVDDRGIDFVTRYENSHFIEIQVKSIRKPGYVFMQKSKYDLNGNLYLALAILNQEEPPKLFLIPSNAWKSPNSLFTDKDYEGKKSKPEWGLNLSKKNMGQLEMYRFDRVIETLIK